MEIVNDKWICASTRPWKYQSSAIAVETKEYELGSLELGIVKAFYTSGKCIFPVFLVIFQGTTETRLLL